jgi:hypothetical protein
MQDGFFSPNDPIFYLHHAMIDRVWREWQASPRNDGNQFDGVHRVLPRSDTNQAVAPVSRSQVIGPAQWGRTVDQIMNGEPTDCVTYTGVGGGNQVVRAVGYETFQDETVVDAKAAKKKQDDVEGYKSACQMVVDTKDSFFEGGKHAGYSTDMINVSYGIKEVFDSITLEVLPADVKDPESVLNKAVEEVANEGRAVYQSILDSGILPDPLAESTSVDPILEGTPEGTPSADAVIEG